MYNPILDQLKLINGHNLVNHHALSIELEPHPSWSSHHGETQDKGMINRSWINGESQVAIQKTHPTGVVPMNPTSNWVCLGHLVLQFFWLTLGHHLVTRCKDGLKPQPIEVWIIQDSGLKITNIHQVWACVKSKALLFCLVCVTPPQDSRLLDHPLLWCCLNLSQDLYINVSWSWPILGTCMLFLLKKYVSKT